MKLNRNRKGQKLASTGDLQIQCRSSKTGICIYITLYAQICKYWHSQLVTSKSGVQFKKWNLILIT